MKPFLLFAFISFLFIADTRAQLLSFPTAEGAGKFSTGGRGSVATAPTIYEVTNLGDVNSPGSFRYACTNGTAPRIVVFRVSGIIHLTSTLNLKANTTIAGQTAPGEGICIADYPVYVGGNNVIVRYMRFRLGDKNQNLGMVNGSGADDAFSDNGNGRTNIVIDHCTMSWSNDEAFTFYSGNNITLQWNFITEPLNYSYHFETGDVDYELHAFGGIWGGRKATFHHNLFAHIKGRAPRFDGIRNISADSGDFRNNVIYNWSDYNTNGGEGGCYNVVNNYYKYGPSTPSTVTSGVNRRNMLVNPYKQTSPAIPYGKYYLVGNYCDNSSAVTNSNWLGAAMNGGSYADTNSAKVTTPFAAVDINMETAQQAYNSVLSFAGCALPNRDTLDQRIANDVINRTGKLIDVQGGYPHGTPYASTVNAWPALANGTAQTDTDHDGMPDDWENARGLNPANAADRNGYISTSGYNNVENYINGDTIVAVGTINTCVNAKSINSTNSGQWLHARDSSYSYYLSPKYNAAVDSNHIVASILDNGSYGSFAVSYYTTNVNRQDIFGWNYARRNITITPANPALITGPVTVRIYISLAEFNALKAADATINTINDVMVLKSSDNTCVTALPGSFSAIQQSGSGLFGTYQNGYYIQFQTSSFSTFYIQSKLAPIPVILSSFDVKKQGTSAAILSWSTSQEINSRNFEVQRSNDGATWSTIGTVNAAGNSAAARSYTFTDASSKKGIFYYRLKQNDLDGRVAISETRKLDFGKDKISIQVFPNPANNELNVIVNDVDQFTLVLSDMTGRKLSTYNSSGNRLQVNTGALAAGYYMLSVTGKGGTERQKLIVHH